MIRWSLVITGIIIISGISLAQQDTTSFTTNRKPNKVKNGFGLGAFPVIGYNTDIGFQYGVIGNLFNYGDGSLYPGYKFSLYGEFSRTTKGSGVNQLFFDARHLIPGGIRLTADASYLTELALNFYGFNGYEAVYRKNFELDNSPEYISRMFYRHERKFMRFTVDFQGPLGIEGLRWFAGLGYFNITTSTVDINRLNKGKDEDKLLPDTSLLYDKYVQWGVIKSNEKNGGKVPSIKAGLIYDTRNQEVNPMHGMWSELLFFYSPPILGNSNYEYLKLAITHRQYFTLIKNDLSFAYRIGYQGRLAGDVPFFMKPYMIVSFAMVTTTDGLGGAKTLRGILRNRVVGDGVAYGNAELRWKFLHTSVWNQNIYLALNGFLDAGRIVQYTEVLYDQDLGPSYPDDYFNPGTERWHVSAGGGFRIVLNQNFVVAVDYGRAFDQRDGSDGIYAGIGYLF